MHIDTAGNGTFLIVLVMAAVTLLTRWGGVFIMSFVPISHRVKLFISAMSGSVIVAILTPVALAGDSATRLALLTTALVMFWLNKSLPAIACGILVAALVRQV